MWTMHHESSMKTPVLKILKPKCVITETLYVIVFLTVMVLFDPQLYVCAPFAY